MINSPQNQEAEIAIIDQLGRVVGNTSISILEGKEIYSIFPNFHKKGVFSLVLNTLGEIHPITLIRY